MVFEFDEYFRKLWPARVDRTSYAKLLGNFLPSPHDGQVPSEHALTSLISMEKVILYDILVSEQKQLHVYHHFQSNMSYISSIRKKHGKCKKKSLGEDKREIGPWYMKISCQSV